MSKVSVFDQGWIDLVFEGRNKAYGAYKLRMEESKTTVFALITGIALLLSLVGIPAAINYLSPAPVADNVPLDKDIELTDIVIPVEKLVTEKPKPIEQQQQAAPAPKEPSQTVAFRPLQPTSAPIVEPVPTQATLQQSNVGSTTSPGDGSNDFSTGVTSSTGGEGTGTTDGEDDNTVHADVALDEAPMFPGGLEKFYKKVGDAFNVPEIGTSTTIKVFVSFVVEKDGSMSNIKVVRDPGYGAGKEAIRVLKSIKTHWKPGKLRGKPVRTAYNLPITINVR